MTKNKFSIITISYNQGELIEETIKSVISQTYKNFEYIIIDGASTDNTLEVIQKYSKQITHFISEPDKGPASALNKGLALATGDFIFYLNSDDMMVSNALESANEIITMFKDFDFFYGNGYLKRGNTIKPIYSGKWSLQHFLTYSPPIVQQSHFIKNSSLLKNLNFNINNKTCWDLELMVDLSLAGYKFKQYSHHLGIFRIHENSITGSANNTSEYENDLKRIKLKCNNLRPFHGLSYIYFWCLEIPTLVKRIKVKLFR